MDLFDEEERLRINTFDWQAEFPQIFAGENPGFDAVIGNPPYIRVRVLREFVPEAVVEFLKRSYRCATHVWDVYLLFYEKALSLTRPQGRFGFIVPIQTLHQPNCESMRNLLLTHSAIRSVIDLSAIRVFDGPLVKNCILICETGTEGEEIELLSPTTSQELFLEPSHSWPQRDALRNPGCSLKVDLLSPKRNLCEKLQSKSRRLDELCYVTFGLRSCAKGKGKGGKDRLITTNPMEECAEPYLEGREIGRYRTDANERYIKYLPKEMYSPRTPNLFHARKLISQTMLSKMRLVATLDKCGYFVEQSLLCIVPHGIVTEPVDAPQFPLEYLLGVVNSRLQSFYFATYIIDYSLGGGLIYATPGSQSKLLVPKASDKDVSSIVGQVNTILSLNEIVRTAKSAHERIAIERQIAATDAEIDRLVYELYGLTDDEIRLVEEATAK